MWCLEHIVTYVFKLYILTIEKNCLMFTCGTLWFCVVEIKGWENINNNLENNNDKGKNEWLLRLLILTCPQSPTSHVIVPRVSCLRLRKCIIVANKLV